MKEKRLITPICVCGQTLQRLGDHSKQSYRLNWAEFMWF